MCFSRNTTKLGPQRHYHQQISSQEKPEWHVEDECLPKFHLHQQCLHLSFCKLYHFIFMLFHATVQPQEEKGQMWVLIVLFTKIVS